MQTFKNIIATVKRFWIWLKSKFVPLYKVTVSYNNVWGDSDDQVFIVKKVMTQKEKHLKFRDWDTKKMVEIRSSSGLDYKIEEK